MGVYAILLVGGESRRFGGPKALARINGETMLEHALHALSRAELVDGIVASVSKKTPREAIELLGEHDISTVWDEEYRLECSGPARGLASSYLATLEYGLQARGYLVVAVDYPRIDSQVIDGLARLWREYSGEPVSATIVGPSGEPLNTLGLASGEAFDSLVGACRVKPGWGLRVRVSDLYRGSPKLVFVGWRRFRGDPCVFASANTREALERCDYTLYNSIVWSGTLVLWEHYRWYRVLLSSLAGGAVARAVKGAFLEGLSYPVFPSGLYRLHAFRDGLSLSSRVGEGSTRGVGGI